MRPLLAAFVCVLAFMPGCQTPKEEPPKDARLLARESYLNVMAERCEKDAAALREQADALIVKAKELELKAKGLRKNAKMAAEGKVVVDPDEEERH